MNDLVFTHNDTLVTTQEKVSSLTNNNQASIQRLIRTYKADLEEFGILDFENIQVIAGDGSTFKKIYYLNEQQATLLLTYMKNTPIVRNAKKALVKEFYRMKSELQALKIALYIDEIEKLKKDKIYAINGYKSQIAQHNNVIQRLKTERDFLDFAYEEAKKHTRTIDFDALNQVMQRGMHMILDDAKKKMYQLSTELTLKFNKMQRIRK